MKKLNRMMAAFCVVLAFGFLAAACGDDEKDGDCPDGQVNAIVNNVPGCYAECQAGVCGVGFSCNGGLCVPDSNNVNNMTLGLTQPAECFPFSDDPDIPLAIDGTFDADSELWRRPHDEEPVCPATGLLPVDKQPVPGVAFAFCNTDTVDHLYTFEMLAFDGPNGEPPLDDPYLILYTGEAIPDDATMCTAVNDDIPEAIDVSDSEIVDVLVPAGGAITMVGTTFTFDPTDGTGTGYYTLIVTNVD